MDELLDVILGSLLYMATGMGLLLVGWFAWDAITPGKLGDLVMGKPALTFGPDDDPDNVYGNLASGKVDTLATETKPSVNAAAMAASGIIATALIIFTALWRTNHDSIWVSLGWAIVFGLFGIGLQVIAFKIMDAVTPGKLAEIVCQHHTFHPATLLVVASTLGSAAIVCVAIA